MKQNQVKEIKREEADYKKVHVMDSPTNVLSFKLKSTLKEMNPLVSV